MQTINSHPTQFPKLNELLKSLTENVSKILGDNFVGAYLQGSAAFGAIDMQSDCDFIIVTSNRLNSVQEKSIRELHREIRTRQEHWAHHLEGSYVPQDELRNLSSLGKKWFFVDQGFSGEDMEWSTHCNTEVVRWILREHGITLTGPDPKELVDKVDPEVLRAKMREDVKNFLPEMLTWMGLGSPWGQRYAVTTLCRLLYTLDTGEVASKQKSLMWAKDNLDPKWQELISEALEGRSLGWNHYDPVKPGSIEQVEAFNEYAKQRALI